MYGIYEIIEQTTSTGCKSNTKTLVHTDVSSIQAVRDADEMFRTPDFIKNGTKISFDGGSKTNEWERKGKYYNGGLEYTIKGYYIVEELPTFKKRSP